MTALRFITLLVLTGCFSQPSGYVLESDNPRDLMALICAVEEWNTQGGYDLYIKVGGVPMPDEARIVWQDHGSDFLAITDHEGRHIILNSNKDYTWYNGVGDCMGNTHDLQTILAHEIGHTLGRKHTIDMADTMYYGLYSCVSKHVLTDNDLYQD